MPGIDVRTARATLTAAGILSLLTLFWFMRGTLLVFVVALLLASLLSPLCDVIARLLPPKSRALAPALTWLLAIAVITAFGAFLGSVITDQAASLTKAAPAILERLKQQPLPTPGQSASLRTQLAAVAETQLREHYNEIVGIVPELTLKVLSLSGNLLYLIIVPIISFFVLKDGRELTNTFLGMFDLNRTLVERLLEDTHTLLIQYMRALSLLCCATFAVFSIVLSLMGVPYALLLASVAFPLEFIPMMGPLAAAVIIIAVTVVSAYPHVIWVVVFLALFRIVQDYVLSPRLMSRGVELHPLLVILGLLAGEEVGGIAGIFLSVPILAVVRLFYYRLKQHRDETTSPAT